MAQTKLQELKDKALKLRNRGNAMTSAQNRDIGEIFLEILNNPAIFEDEELFQFATESNWGFATGTLADLEDESTETFVTPEVWSASFPLGQYDTIFKFPDLQPFNKLRITYKSGTSGAETPPGTDIEIFTEDPYGSGNFSSNIRTLANTDDVWLTVDIDIPAENYTIGADLGINLLGGHGAYIAYMALV